MKIFKVGTPQENLFSIKVCCSLRFRAKTLTGGPYGSRPQLLLDLFLLVSELIQTIAERNCCSKLEIIILRLSRSEYIYTQMQIYLYKEVMRVPLCSRGSFISASGSRSVGNDEKRILEFNCLKTR